jgi:UPF0755 protein
MYTRVFIIAIILAAITATFGGLVWYQHKQSQSKVQSVSPKEQQKITIIEGWDTFQIKKYLSEKNVVSETDFKNTLGNPQLLQEYEYLSKLALEQSLEGYLFPDTYLVNKPATADEVVRKFLDNFLIKWNIAKRDATQTADQTFIIPGYNNLSLNSNARGLTIHELVTLASILEKETGRNIAGLGQEAKLALQEERSIVAGIFYNRLLIGQGLESDATINYVSGKNDPSPLLSDTRIKSAYNTYINRGLPPGPIANPSLSSLQAVLAPTKTDYYYFLHKQPSGEVVYSKTFAEHVKNKNKFLK